MNHFRGILIAAAVLSLAVPAAVSAQKDSRYTREVSKFLGLALTRPDEASRLEMYQKALEAANEGIAKDADNAKVWLLAGQVHAALNNYAQADSAFERAIAMHPEYAQEVQAEREQAWMTAFNEGVALMDQQDFPGAIAALEAANELYPDRPEGYLNLGSLYANAQRTEDAVRAFEGAIAAAQSDLAATVPAETQAQWQRYAQLARSNIAQIHGSEGVRLFQAQQFEDAAAAFKRAMDINPHARDFHFNYAQAMFARSQRLEEQKDSADARLARAAAADKAAAQAEVDRLAEEMRPLYNEMIAASEKTLEFDPANEMLYVLIGRAHRMLGALGDEAATKAGQDRALALLTQREELPVHIGQISMRSEPEATTVSGAVIGGKAAAGTAVTIRVTLVGLDGNTVGESEVTVTSAGPDAEAPFSVVIPTTGEVAGWKYQVVN